MSKRNGNGLLIIIFLSLIFFFSGFSSIIYQVVWQRILTLYYGGNISSITLIVTVYMLGLGLGSLIGGIISEKIKNRITLYFIIELLIGAFGAFSITLITLLGSHTAGSDYHLTFIYVFLLLCFPTLLMGMTLPLLTKIFVDIIHNFTRTVSLLYFINTLGAAAGAIICAYVLISFGGLDTAVNTATLINFILAGVIFFVRFIKPSQINETLALPPDNERSLGRVVFLLVFITGFVAIGYEIIWYRILGILVKDSPYAFASILGVYLAGIALGSFIINRITAKKKINKMNTFFILQFAIGFFVMISIILYFYLTKFTGFSEFSRLSFNFIPHPPVTFKGVSSSVDLFRHLYATLDIFILPLIFIFIPTVLMGASFPLIASVAPISEKNAAKKISVTYFFNILGNAAGGFFTGYLLIDLVGSEIVLLIFSSIGIFLGVFASEFKNIKLHPAFRIGMAALLIIINFILFPKYTELTVTMHSAPGAHYNIYTQEGRDALIVTYQNNDTILNYINGLGHGNRPNLVYTFKALEAMSYAGSVEKVLIIGYGTGTTVETVLKSDEVKKITLVEISPSLITNLRKITFFDNMLADKRIDLIIDGGRRFLLRNKEKYDLVLIDPVYTTAAYSNNLYSRDFFKLVKDHLNINGVFMFWTDEFRVMPKTLTSVFPEARIYSTFCLGSTSAFIKNEKRFNAVLSKFSAEESLRILQWNIYRGDHNYIRAQYARYPVNTDMKPCNEYYLGLSRFD